MIGECNMIHWAWLIVAAIFGSTVSLFALAIVSVGKSNNSGSDHLEKEHEMVKS